MILDAIPKVAVGPVRLGEPGGEAVKALGGEYSTFTKAPGLPPTLAFDSYGLHLHLDDNGAVSGVEAWGPAQIHLKGIPLLHRPLEAIAKELRDVGIEVLRDPEGAELSGLAIGLYAPQGDVEGVTLRK